jgi:hypothetical protein
VPQIRESYLHTASKYFLPAHDKTRSRGGSVRSPKGGRATAVGPASLAGSLVETAVHALSEVSNQPLSELAVIDLREQAISVVAAMLGRLGGTTRKKGLLPFHHAASQQLLRMAKDLGERA